MTEVIEYIEKLEVLEATNKQSGAKKNDKDRSEDKTGKSKKQGLDISQENSKFKGKKRKRNGSISEDYQYDKYFAICKVKGGPFWTQNTEDCRTLVGFRKKKHRVTVQQVESTLEVAHMHKQNSSKNNSKINISNIKLKHKISTEV